MPIYINKNRFPHFIIASVFGLVLLGFLMIGLYKWFT